MKTNASNLWTQLMSEQLQGYNKFLAQVKEE